MSRWVSIRHGSQWFGWGNDGLLGVEGSTVSRRSEKLGFVGIAARGVAMLVHPPSGSYGGGVLVTVASS